MLENRKLALRVLPLLAVIGCADASEPHASSHRTDATHHDDVDEVIAPVEHAHDDAHHAHDDDDAVGYADDGADPEVARERASADAGARPSKPASTTRDAATSAPRDAVFVDAGSDAQVAPPSSGAEVEGSAPTFDAGAGVLQPDGKTVVFRIPNGTGNKSWNTADKPVKIKRGMTLRLIDDDKTAKGGGHWLHSFGICPHSTRPIGTGYECKIPASAKTGLQSGLFEHNVANAGGRIYLVVVD